MIEHLTPEGLRQIRTERKIGLRELARCAMISPATISNFEAGRRGLSPTAERSLLEALGETVRPPIALQNAEVVRVTRRVPVIGMAAAAMYDPALSQLCDLWEGSDETVPCAIDNGATLALRIQGDSMAPCLHHGDIVAVDPNTLPSTGDLAVVCLRDEGLVIKRWYWKRGVIRLESLNAAGKSYEWTKEEVFQQGIILWRWKVLGVLWHKL